MQKIAQKIILAVLKGYKRLLSPLLGPMLGVNCRFWPSCADYALQAIEQHGVMQGGWLSLKRFGRCHPGRTAGVDLPPPRAPRHPRKPGRAAAAQS